MSNINTPASALFFATTAGTVDQHSSEKDDIVIFANYFFHPKYILYIMTFMRKKMNLKAN
jgi:hypothetical protein